MRLLSIFFIAGATLAMAAALIFLSVGAAAVASIFFLAAMICYIESDDAPTRPAWVSEPVKDNSPADANWRRLYLGGQLTTDEFVNAVEKGERPTKQPWDGYLFSPDAIGEGVRLFSNIVVLEKGMSVVPVTTSRQITDEHLQRLIEHFAKPLSCAKDVFPYCCGCQECKHRARRHPRLTTTQPSETINEIFD